MCLYPQLIRNPKYKENKKNGGAIPPFSDDRVLSIPIGCGNCMQCRKQKARNWQYRIIEEAKRDTRGKFITLTFSNEKLQEYYKLAKKKIEERREKQEYSRRTETTGYDLDNEAAAIAVRRFLERWRKKHKKSVKHWLITELGHNGTERIHLHGIIWGEIDEIENIWGNGFVWKGKKINETYQNYVNEKTAGYITKYMTKIDKDHPNYKSIVLCSKGIGKCWTDGKKTEIYRSNNGHKIALNNYWKNKMFSEEEKEQMWIEKLDKNERYINGVKYKATDFEAIEQALILARELNKELGYGGSTKDYQKIEYEKKNREINQKKIYKKNATAGA